MNKNIICIDLKSFFASCECLDRNLDPFKVNLIVADPERKSGAITLAVSPALRAKGVPGRCRVYEIPKHLKYIVAPPRMNLYLKKSEEVKNVFKSFVSEDDLFVYSIDEAFLDVTKYLNLYKMDDFSLAKTILKNIKEKTGLYATCGIGPNMFLAKVAMDIEAKHNKDFIAKWTYDDIKNKLWTISPLSRIWGIGKKTEAKLNNMGIHSVKELAQTDKNILIKKFGIAGNVLWKHANGIEDATISDFKILPKDSSYSHSQVLFKDYFEDNIHIIISEMCDVIATRLRKNKKLSSLVSFGVAYSKSVTGGFSHMHKLDTPTDNSKIIYDTCMYIFNRHYDNNPIRKVFIAMGKLSDKDTIQLNIFEEVEETIKDDKENEAIDKIKEKFGNNSIIKASNLLRDSTAIKRNKKVRGHNAD